jgi:hypothetical protein
MVFQNNSLIYILALTFYFLRSDRVNVPAYISSSASTICVGLDCSWIGDCGEIFALDIMSKGEDVSSDRKKTYSFSKVPDTTIF